MAYIGNNLTVQQYAPTITYFSGNASTTAFTLPYAVVTAAQIIVTVENVIQNPSSAFTVSGTTITFTSAPPSGTNNIWVEYTSLQTTVNTLPSNPSVVGNLTASGTITGSSFSGAGTGLTGTASSLSIGGSAASVANALTAGTGITFSAGTTYDGSAAITISASGGTSPIPAGSVFVLYQAAAPTGWTQVTTLNDYDLRLVSGTGGGTGGTTAYSTVFANQTPTFSGSNGTLAISATTLSTTQIPSHTHTFNTISAGGSQTLIGLINNGGPYEGVYYSTTSTNASGGGGSHTHSLSGTISGTVSAVTLNVRYANVIICSKN